MHHIQCPLNIVVLRHGDQSSATKLRIHSRQHTFSGPPDWPLNRAGTVLDFTRLLQLDLGLDSGHTILRIASLIASLDAAGCARQSDGTSHSLGHQLLFAVGPQWHQRTAYKNPLLQEKSSLRNLVQSRGWCLCEAVVFSHLKVLDTCWAQTARSNSRL